MPKQKPSKNKAFDRYWDDSDWAIVNAQALSESYPNEWVAIYEKKVIAHDRKLSNVMLEVRNRGVSDPVFKFSEGGIHVYKSPIAIETEGVSS
ncbi:MAG: DUF5678 domain-containing protein [bacterium]